MNDVSQRRVLVLGSALAVFSGWAAVTACGDDAPPADATTAPTTASGTAPKGTTPTPSSTATTPGGDAASTRVARYKEVKGVLHVHSAYSHDACDGDGIVDGGLNLPCVADLRAAPCNVGLDFVNLTDHPAHMNEYEPAKNLLFDAAKGDELVMGQDGTSPIGNRITCPDGRKVLFTFGYEGTHTLPLIFERHPTRYDSYTTLRPLSEVTSLVADLKDAGAIVGLAHSEQSDLTPDLIINGGADLMEWYNPHGNFLKTLGASDKVSGNPLTVLSFFGSVDTFLAGSKSGAAADLIYLPLLKEWPVEGFDKWRTVQRTKHVPGVFGSDVHQNISIDPVCKGSSQALCVAAAGSNGSALALLIAGGQLVLSDGKRLDTYDRILRWLRNVVLTNDLSPAGLRSALAGGRSYGVFSVFGEPTGFFFEGAAGGKAVDLGDTASGSVSFTVQVPALPTPTLTGVAFTPAEAKDALVRAVLYRSNAKGTTEVASATTLGGTLTTTTAEAGAYHVEIWIKPKHLVGKLGPKADLADREYLWLISNTIRISG